MNLFSTSDIDYPFTVTVSRPTGAFGENGAYTGTLETVIASMAADIQFSLKVRQLTSEDRTGISDTAVWVMFCNPPSPIRHGDRVYDGSRTFAVNSVSEWGTHTECVMRIV
ncbi:hypothetical protein LLG96_02075 [bacterium]|nr:hypothetical protein [bacterium]